MSISTAVFGMAPASSLFPIPMRGNELSYVG